jgi:hypothetical protein
LPVEFTSVSSVLQSTELLITAIPDTTSRPTHLPSSPRAPPISAATLS